MELCCVSLVLHYLSDIPCKNYNCTFVFVKVTPKTLLVPFFSDTVSRFTSQIVIFAAKISTIFQQSDLYFPKSSAFQNSYELGDLIITANVREIGIIFRVCTHFLDADNVDVGYHTQPVSAAVASVPHHCR